MFWIILRISHLLQGRLLLHNLTNKNPELFLHVYKINLRRKNILVFFFLMKFYEHFTGF